jgi:hypothetical protein
MRAPHSSNAGFRAAPRASRLYRGSSKRVRRIRLRGIWSAEFWVWMVLVVFFLLVVIPWIVTHWPGDVPGALPDVRGR